jgi:hydrogenase/urease accessory protein HupE
MKSETAGKADAAHPDPEAAWDARNLRAGLAGVLVYMIWANWPIRTDEPMEWLLWALILHPVLGIIASYVAVRVGCMASVVFQFEYVRRKWIRFRLDWVCIAGSLVVLAFGGVPWIATAIAYFVLLFGMLNWRRDPGEGRVDVW